MIGLIINKRDLLHVLDNPEIADKIIESNPEIVFIDVKTNGGIPGKKLYQQVFSNLENVEIAPMMNCYFTGAKEDIDLFLNSTIPLYNLMLNIPADFREEYLNEYAEVFALHLKKITPLGKHSGRTVIICGSLHQFREDGSAYKLGKLLTDNDIPVKFCPVVNSITLISNVIHKPYAISPIIIQNEYSRVMNIEDVNVFYWTVADFIALPKKYRSKNKIVDKSTLYKNVSTINLSVYEQPDKTSAIIGKIQPGDTIQVDSKEEAKHITWAVFNGNRYAIMKENGVEYLKP